jgi:ABC-type Mn2+/Zn2+ transport system permease subunit
MLQTLHDIVTDFLSSWSLFSDMYLAGWLIAGVLAMAGVLVVARDQIFLGAAVAQSSTLGIALALWLESTLQLEHSALAHGLLSPSLFAVVCAVLAAILAGGSRGAGRESNEAVTGWVFLFSASASVLVVAKSPHGLDEIQKLLSSTILGATTADVCLFGILFVATAMALLLCWRKLLLLTLDAPMATAVGMRTRVWSLAMSVCLGLIVGLTLRASGLLYTFGCLVLPALCAKNLCREVRWMFWVAPVIALGTAATGFILANYYDYPPTQATVALQSLLLVAIWCRSHWFQARTTPS